MGEGGVGVTFSFPSLDGSVHPPAALHHLHPKHTQQNTTPVPKRRADGLVQAGDRGQVTAVGDQGVEGGRGLLDEVELVEHPQNVLVLLLADPHLCVKGSVVSWVLGGGGWVSGWGRLIDWGCGCCVCIYIYRLTINQPSRADAPAGCSAPSGPPAARPCTPAPIFVYVMVRR